MLVFQLQINIKEIFSLSTLDITILGNLHLESAGTKKPCINVLKFAGVDHFDVTGIDKIANVVSLLMTKFTFVQDEFKLQR